MIQIEEVTTHKDHQEMDNLLVTKRAHILHQKTQIAEHTMRRVHRLAVRRATTDMHIRQQTLHANHIPMTQELHSTGPHHSSGMDNMHNTQSVPPANLKALPNC